MVGVDRDCLRLAERVNDCKAALREVCAPLQRVRRRVPVKGGGTESIPVVRAMLRSIQRSEVNLLAAYRRLPILGAPPQSIAYTRAKTRAVYRKTIAEIGDLLQTNDSPAAIRDRARLAGLRADAVARLEAGGQHIDVDGDEITVETVSGKPDTMPPPGFIVPPELLEVHKHVPQIIGPHILTGPVAVDGALPIKLDF